MPLKNYGAMLSLYSTAMCEKLFEITINKKKNRLKETLKKRANGKSGK
jgi:hypothetical protein